MFKAASSLAHHFSDFSLVQTICLHPYNQDYVSDLSGMFNA